MLNYMIKKLIKKPKGRPRRCFTYSEASKIIQSEGISSKREYDRWWKFNMPSRMPKRPDCAYRNYNFKWSEFLGTNNPFPIIRIKYKSYDESKKYAHSLGLKTRSEWLIHCKSGKKPNDIPVRPDMFYQKTGKWISWKDYLGVSLVTKHEFFKLHAKRLFYIVRLPNRPLNVYKLGDTYSEVEKIIEMHNNKQLQIVKIFYYKNNQFDWKSIIKNYGIEYNRSMEDDEYVIYNISILLNDIKDEMIDL